MRELSLVLFFEGGCSIDFSGEEENVPNGLIIAFEIHLFQFLISFFSSISLVDVDNSGIHLARQNPIAIFFFLLLIYVLLLQRKW